MTEQRQPPEWTEYPGRESERLSGATAGNAEAYEMIARLTARERQVMCLVAAGGSSKSIAQHLGISRRTVEMHRANIMDKLYARSTADVVRLAIYAGLLE